MNEPTKRELISEIIRAEDRLSDEKTKLINMARLTQCASLSAVDEAGQMLAALADFMELVASNISAIYEALNTTRNALSE